MHSVRKKAQHRGYRAASDVAPRVEGAGEARTLPPVPIFKAYDIRGVVPDELDAPIAYRIGRAAARFIGADTLVIGRDARRSSPELFEAALRGVCD